MISKTANKYDMHRILLWIVCMCRKQSKWMIWALSEKCQWWLTTHFGCVVLREVKYIEYSFNSNRSILCVGLGPCTAMFVCSKWELCHGLNATGNLTFSWSENGNGNGNGMSGWSLLWCELFKWISNGKLLCQLNEIMAVKVQLSEN